MSVQISCTICGESSPRTIDTGPATEWSRKHRCSIPKLLELAKERAAVVRLGMNAREAERDLAIMGELARHLVDAEARADAAAAVDPEWEYGATGFDPTRIVSLRDSLEDAEHSQRYWIEAIGAPSVVMKRTPGRKPGPWLPVTQT